MGGGEFFMLELSASLLTSPHGGVGRGGILRIGTLSFFAYLWTKHQQGRREGGGNYNRLPSGPSDTCAHIIFFYL